MRRRAHRLLLAMRVAVGCAALLFLGATAAEARPKAFIVGNSNYRFVTVLPNPANDASDLAARLKGMGYDVVLGLDLPRTEFLEKFKSFARSLQADDLALVFFAGHGMQVGGENYLFPVDARVETEDDARTQLVALNALLAEVSRSTRSRIVILDACRNNPFTDDLAARKRSRAIGLTRGLARVYAGVGSFVAYSTQPGNVAEDGAGRNSPFTAALLRHIAQPGIDVHGVMRLVRADVQQATSQSQIPWENSSLIDEVTFTGHHAAPAAPSAPSEPQHDTVRARYAFVTGLDPDGDNFLALRSSPDADGTRLSTMAEGTPLTILDSRGIWKHVRLLDGTTGWAHGQWIACCQTLPAGQPIPATPATPAGVDGTCDGLWLRRNAIFHRYGYCFETERGRRAFGNEGCSRDVDAALSAMSADDRNAVGQLAGQEKDNGCR